MHTTIKTSKRVKPTTTRQTQVQTEVSKSLSSTTTATVANYTKLCEQLMEMKLLTTKHNARNKSQSVRSKNNESYNVF